MPYNGAGTFSVYTPGTPYVTGTVISSTVANNVNSDFATGLSTAITKNGQTTVTANIPFGGFKLTGIANGSVATDAMAYGQIATASGQALSSVAGTNTITAAATPTLTAYATGQFFRFIAANTCSGATTINIDSVGAKNIFRNGIACVSGDIVINKIYGIFYDGTQFNLQETNEFAKSGANTDITSLQSSTTVTTQAVGDNSTKIASTAFVAAAVPFANWTPFNAEDRVWGAGIAAVKTSWTAYGASATYAKNTTAAQIKDAAGSAITRVGTDCGQSANIALYPGWPTINYWQGKTVTYGRWVYATVASRARIGINTGVNQVYSSYHTGNSTLQFLTVTTTIGAAETAVTLQDQVDTGNTTAVFSGGGFVTGNYLADSMPPAWVGRKCMWPFGFNTAGLLTAGSTGFFQSGMSSTTEANLINQTSFNKAVYRNLYGYSNTSPGGGQTYTMTFRLNNADTALTSTIGTSQVGSDLTHEVAANAGAGFCVKCVASGGAATTTTLTFNVEVEEVPL